MAEARWRIENTTENKQNPYCLLILPHVILIAYYFSIILEVPKFNIKGEFVNKKWLVRAAVVLGVLMATLLVAAPAMAMWSWCSLDPTLNIGGHTVSLQADIQGDPDAVNGNIWFNVTVPKGTPVSVVYIDPGAKVKIYYTDGSSKNKMPVNVSVVDINTRDIYPSRLIVSLDGNQIALVEGTTADDLNYNFTIR